MTFLSSRFVRLARESAFLSSAAIVVMLAGVGCSSAVTEAGSAHQADVINPGDNEHESHLVLALPADACMAPATCPKVINDPYLYFYVDEANVQLGGDTRLKPGVHSIKLSLYTGSQYQNAVFSVTTTADQTLTVTLPVVARKCAYATLPNVPTTDFGTTPDVHLAACPVTATVAGGISWPMGDDAWHVFPVGQATATVNGVDQHLTVNAGDELEFNLSVPVVGTVPSTFATKLRFKSARTTGDAQKVAIYSSCSGDRNWGLWLDLGSTAPAPLDLTAFVNPSCTYKMYVASTILPLSQTSANDITLNRLDVNDVTVTREDGTKYTTRGQWTLKQNGDVIVGPYPTGFGVDLLPGTYEFTVTYTTFDGQKTQTQTVTL